MMVWAPAFLPGWNILIAGLELAIEKLKRELRGRRSERTALLIDQMELQLEELVMAATEDDVAAQAAAAKTSSVRSFTRKRPVRKPWPEDIERERVVIDPQSPVHAAADRGFPSWARTSPRRWKRFRVGSKWSRRCGRNLPAETARDVKAIGNTVTHSLNRGDRY